LFVAHFLSILLKILLPEHGLRMSRPDAIPCVFRPQAQ
jgi:hypothetical protein